MTRIAVGLLPRRARAPRRGQCVSPVSPSCGPQQPQEPLSSLKSMAERVALISGMEGDVSSLHLTSGNAPLKAPARETGLRHAVAIGVQKFNDAPPTLDKNQNTVSPHQPSPTSEAFPPSSLQNYPAPGLFVAYSETNKVPSAVKFFLCSPH